VALHDSVRIICVRTAQAGGAAGGRLQHHQRFGDRLHRQVLSLMGNISL